MTSALIAALQAVTDVANKEGDELAVLGRRDSKDVTLTYLSEALHALTVLRDKLVRPSDPNERAKSIVDQVTRDD